MVLETIDKENTSNQRVLKPSTPPSKKSTNLLDSVSPKKIVEEIVETESQDDGVPSDEVSEMHPGSPVHNQRANRINQLKQEVTQLKQVKEVEIERKYTHCSTVEDFIPNENWETQDIDDQSSERNYTEEEVKEILSIQADRIKSFEVDLINLQEDCIQYQQEYFKIKEEGCALYEFFISKTNSLKDLKEKYHIICEQYELQRAENNELLLQLEHSNLLASEWKLKHKQQADRFKENIESYKHMKSENHGLKEEIQTLHDKLDRLSSNGSHNNAQSSAQISEVSALNKQLTATIENYKKQIENRSVEFEELKENYDNLIHSQQLQANQLLFLKKKCANLFTELTETIMVQDQSLYNQNDEIISMNQKVQDILFLLQTDDESLIQQSINSHSQLDVKYDSFKPRLSISSANKPDKGEKKSENSEEIESLQISNEILRSEIDELQKKLHQSQLQSSKYENQSQVSKLQIQNLQLNITQLQEQVNSSSSSSSNLSNEIQLLRLKVRSLDSEISQLSQDNQIMSSERANSISKISELQTLNNNLQNDMRLLYKKHKMDLAQLNDTYQHEEYKSRYQAILVEFNQMKNHYQTSFDLFDGFMELIAQYDQLKDVVEGNAELVLKVHNQNALLNIDRSIQSEYEKLNSQFTHLQTEHQKLLDDFNSLFNNENIEMNDNNFDNQMKTNFGVLVNNLKEQNEKFSTSQKELQKSLTEKEESVKVLTFENKKFSSDLDEITNRYSDLLQKEEYLESENMQMIEMIKQHDVLSQKFDELLMKISSQNQFIQSEVANYQQLIQSKDQEIESLTNQLEGSNSKNHSLSLQIQFLNEKLQFSTSQMEEVEKELEKLQSKLINSEMQEQRSSDLSKKKEKGLLDQISDLQNTVEIKDKKIQKMEVDMEKKISLTAEEHEQQITKLNTNIQKLEKQTAVMKSQIDQLTEQFNDKEKEILKKEKEIEKQNDRMNEIVQQNQTTVEEYQFKISKLDDQSKQLENSLKNKEVDWNNKEQEYLVEKDKLKLEIEELTNTNEEITKKIAQMKSIISEYQLKAANLKQQLENETLLSAQLKKSIESLKTELGNQCVEMKVTENERDQLLLQNEILLVVCDEKGILKEATLLNEKNELQRDLTSIRIRMEEKDLRIKDLQSHVTQHQNRFVELKEKYKSKLVDFQSQLNHSTEETQCLNTMLTHIRNLVAMHQDEIRQSEKLQSLLSLIPQPTEC